MRRSSSSLRVVAAAASLSGLAAAVACTSFRSDDEEATPPVAADSGPETSAADEAAPPPDAAPEPPASEPITFLAPSNPRNRVTSVEPLDFTLGALDTTLDLHASATGPTVQSGPDAGLVYFSAVQDGTHIVWTAGAAQHDVAVEVRTDQANVAGAFVHKVRLEPTNGPIVRVARGASVMGRVDYRMWNAAGSSQRRQITYGIESATDCFVDATPGTYSSSDTTASKPNATFSIKAPATPGLYKIRTAFTSAASCAGAMQEPLGDTEIAAIYVE